MANGTASRRASTAAPRVYPVGRAVLLLAICGSELAGRRMTIDGRRVQAVRFGSLALLLSFVDQSAYSDAEVSRKRLEPAWLATEARALERAVERANASGPVLPMKLLTVFPHSDALEASVRTSEARWQKALARLGNKREIVVHVYGGPHVAPDTEAYVARVSARASRAGRTPIWKGDPEVVERVGTMWRELIGVAAASRRIAPLPARGAFFSAALLVAESDLDGVRALVTRLSDLGAPYGLSLYLEGPRLPYTFV